MKEFDDYKEAAAAAQEIDASLYAAGDGAPDPVEGSRYYVPEDLREEGELAGQVRLGWVKRLRRGARYAEFERVGIATGAEPNYVAPTRAEAALRQLPPLQGSERQVAWAEKLRREQFLGLVEFALVDNPESARLYEICVATCAAHTEAKFWIDNAEGSRVISQLRREAREIAKS
ncbi:MAG: hypothetical protein L0229_20310 [Blastocatellia bacterium]|nr:hypothetical protein [Blastocatellia bacterium]